MVVLLLATPAFDILGRDKPLATVQVHMAPLGGEQFAYPTQGAQADPERQFGFLLERTYTAVLLPSRERAVNIRHACAFLMQFA